MREILKDEKTAFLNHFFYLRDTKTLNFISPMNSQEIQGEHKLFPSLQTFITMELNVAPQLEEFQPWIFFQQDCEPPHWGFTDSSVFGCNISKHVDWERWSDTLATTIAGYHLLGFFLWGYVKDKVFSTPVPDITNFKARITDVFATTTEDMLENTVRETDYRLDVLRATKGAHVEVY